MVLPVLPIKAQFGMNIVLSADIKIGHDNAGINTPLSVGLGILVGPYLLVTLEFVRRLTLRYLLRAGLL